MSPFHMSRNNLDSYGAPPFSYASFYVAYLTLVLTYYRSTDRPFDRSTDRSTDRSLLSPCLTCDD